MPTASTAHPNGSQVSYRAYSLLSGKLTSNVAAWSIHTCYAAAPVKWHATCRKAANLFCSCGLTLTYRLFPDDDVLPRTRYMLRADERALNRGDERHTVVSLSHHIQHHSIRR
ncbi:hypothetical protein TGFOU_403100 [Toxoplasma gondii FOU]|uniref:Uncharacterized protein n=1 Tax=Toxoplasma gondii FOU TaxID=943167 RepID=A0A086LE53_TOXGO|nr:hypothetical protein TGFOU_403100 [Toxoplasma gondii FOU]